MWIEVKTSSETMRSEIRIEIFEVVAVPGHERAKHIAPERQFAELGRRTVANDVAGGHRVADFHQRPLVDAGVLVRPLEFEQIVDVDRGGFGVGLGGRPDDDPGGIHLVDDARAAGDDRDAGIAGDRLLHPGTHKRRLGADQRYRLPLHVRTHQRPIGVVVFEKRDQRRRHRDQLFRRNVDQINVLRPLHHKVTASAAIGQLGQDPTVAVGRHIGLRDRVAAFVHRREVDDLVGHPAIDDLSVRTFDKAVLIDPRVGREAIDQTDIGAFRRLDRADPPVMRRMHVAHLKTGAFAGQAARAQRREPTLVGDLRQRVRLIHELRELRGPEKLAYRRCRGFGIDQIVRHDRVDFDRAHSFADRPLHPQQANAVLVLHQLTDRADPPVAEMVDVVDFAATVLQLDQNLEDCQDVGLA